MGRTEFEARLLRDPELRRRMEKLEGVAKRVSELQREVDFWRETMQYGITDLASEGVPLSILAHLVGLSPQRMNSVVKEVIDKARSEMSDPDDPEALAVALRANWTESAQRLEQETEHERVEELLADELRATGTRGKQREQKASR